MKKRFFDDIRAGRKTTTVRFWKRLMTRPGQVHTVPGLGKVRIDDVREIALGALSDADAVADGFASTDELIATLKQMYPTLSDAGVADGRTLYVVGFTYPHE